jgi:hypothetical protein
MSMKTTTLALLALGVLSAGLAQAQPMRCRNDLAQVGDHKASVLQKCGEPASKDSFCKPADPLGTPAGAASVVVLPCERVDEWTYIPGYGQFITTLRFEANTLKSIRYGDRVK